MQNVFSVITLQSNRKIFITSFTLVCKLKKKNFTLINELRRNHNGNQDTEISNGQDPQEVRARIQS